MRSISQAAVLCISAAYLCGCVTKPPEVSEKDKTDAMSALFACLHDAARKLDDQRSEASTVALGLRPARAAEFAQTREIYGRQLNPQARQMYHRDDNESFIQIATSVVLEDRAKRR